MVSFTKSFSSEIFVVFIPALEIDLKWTVKYLKADNPNIKQEIYTVPDVHFQSFVTLSPEC